MTIELMLAIYVALVSSLVAGLNIYAIFHYKARVQVKAGLGFPVGLVGPGPICLYIEVVNIGFRPLTIEGCGLQLSHRRVMSYLPHPGELPKRLKEKDKFKVRIELDELRAQLAGEKGKVTGLWARDSTGQMYKGNLPSNIKDALNKPPE